MQYQLKNDHTGAVTQITANGPDDAERLRQLNQTLTGQAHSVAPCWLLEQLEQKEQRRRRDRLRQMVLNALDEYATDHGHSYGWKDQDLPALFRALDAQHEIIEQRAVEARRGAEVAAASAGAYEVAP